MNIYYLGPGDADLEDVRRLITQALQPAATKTTQAYWGGPIAAQGVTPVPVEVGAGVPLIERSIPWSRWSSGTGRQYKLEPDSTSVQDYYTQNLRAIYSLRKFLYKAARVENVEPFDTPEALVSIQHWRNDIQHETSATLGRVVYPTIPPNTTTSSMEKTGNLPNRQALQKTINTRHEFLTTIPGLRLFLQNLDSTNLIQREELCIKLTPSENLGVQANLAGRLPNLVIRVAINTDTKSTKISTVKLVTQETESDLLLSNEALDVRYTRKSYISAGERIDQRIHDFIEASNLDIWAKDRLKTPASLKISIPKHAIRPKAGASEHSSSSGGNDAVNYTFASLIHRSYIQDEYLGLGFEYAIIEAGRIGGRRDQLRLTLSKPTRDHNAKTSPNSFGSLFKAAHSLVKDLGPRKIAMPKGPAVASVARRRKVGLGSERQMGEIRRLKSSIRNRRQLIRAHYIS